MNKIKGKVTVVGDPHVGKTTLIQMFNSNNSNYIKDYSMT